MASNYEQPKLATSKQYNVSQGNIGQVKQQTVDWSGYESAKIWEAVVKGTGQVNEAIQMDAKLRGALDQTGNLVANNSWLTQDSYDQGRAMAEAQKRKGSFLEQSQAIASEIAKKNGTMEDYNNAITPIFQEYIKTIRDVRLTDVQGNPVDVDLQGEFLKNQRQEMITFAALGQQTFQKALEQQHAIDLDESTSNVGGNLYLSLQTVTNAGDVVPRIINAYEQMYMLNSTLGDPVKAKIETDSKISAALEQYTHTLNNMNPLDAAKASNIRSLLNSPGFNMNVVAKGKVFEAIDKFEKDVNGVVEYTISGNIESLEASAINGTYNPGDELRILADIQKGVMDGTLTFSEADALRRRISSFNEKIAKSAENSSSTVLDVSATGAASYDNHPAKAYKAIAMRGEEAGKSVEEMQQDYLQYATSGWRKERPEYLKYLIGVKAAEMSPGLPSTAEQNIPDFMDATTEEGIRRYKSNWKALVDISTHSTGNFILVSDELPKEYRQPFNELAAAGKLTGDYVKDLQIMQGRRRDIAREAASDKTVHRFEASDFNASFLPWSGNQFQKESDYFNSYGETTREALAADFNFVLSDPRNMQLIRGSGVSDVTNANGVISAAMSESVGLLHSTGKYAVISKVPQFIKRLQNGSQATTDKDINNLVHEHAKALIEANGGSNIFTDRNFIYTFDETGFHAKAYDERTSREVPLQGNTSISMQEIKAKISSIEARAEFTNVKPLRMPGTKVDINIAQILKTLPNSTLIKEHLTNIHIFEGTEVYPPRATNPKYPEDIVVGYGVMKRWHSTAFETIVEGYKTGDQELVNKGHTAAIETQIRDAMPALRRVFGTRDMQTLSAVERKIAAAILDVAYADGGLGAKKFADAINVRQRGYTSEQALIASETVSADFKNSKGEYNARGKKLIEALELIKKGMQFK